MEDDPGHDQPSIFSRYLLTRAPVPDKDDLVRPTGSILLPHAGYISDSTNATTAHGSTKDKKHIQVTFWMAPPPRSSCFTVYSRDLKPSAFGDKPQILASDDDLVFLRIPICPPGLRDHPDYNDFFIYQAGRKKKRQPSLQLIPMPPDLFFTDSDVGLLRYRSGLGDDSYLILLLRRANPDRDPSDPDDELFDLYLYNSKTKAWTSKLMRFNSKQKFLFAYPSKVITIGGVLGSVGWVDLWRGILICDVLLGDNCLRYIPLPPPLVPNSLSGPPLFVRDIIAFEGCIKYFEMHLDVPGPASQGWEAATWIWRNASWKKDCEVKISEDVEGAECTTLPTLKGLFSGFPALSLHDQDVVYIMDRDGPGDQKPSVIAVDMRNKTVKDVAEFRTGRPLGYSHIYFQSSISEQLHRFSIRGNAAETSNNEIAQGGKQALPGEGVALRGRNPRLKLQSRMEASKKYQKRP